MYTNQLRIYRESLTIGVLVPFLFFFTATAFPEEPVDEGIQIGSFPVPVWIDFDGPVIPTSLYIKCKYIPYDMSYAEFARSRTSETEIKFKDVVSATRQQDVSACLDLFSGGSGFEGEEKDRYIKKAERNIKSYTDELQDLSSDALRVETQLLVGKERLLFWRTDQPKNQDIFPHPFRKVTLFRHDESCNLVWKVYWGPTQEIIILFKEIMKLRSQPNTQFREVQKHGFDYEFPVAGTIDGHTVYLQFNGRVCDLNVFEEPADADDEILSFYQKAYQTLKDESPKAFAQMYSPKSRDRYLKWMKSDDKPLHEDYIKRHHKDIIESGRTVVFILDADPYYFVFYEQNNKPGWIRFEEIMRDPSDHTLKLTNFGSRRGIQHFLRKDELFINPILKKHILKDSK